MDNPEEFRCISLCTGYGGIELGLREVIPNLRTVAYVEVEAFACANLVAKIEEGKLDAAPIWTDIKTFDGEPFRDRIHLITGGYPCQPFSVAGKRKGHKDPRHLWPYIEEQIRTIRPLFCFFENVSGHLTIGFADVYRSLRNLGYSVEAGLFSAAECGAPHRRERLFILGYSKQSGYATTKEPRGIATAISNNTQRQDATSKSQGTSIAGKLADTESAGMGQGIIEETQAEIRRDRFAVGSMANATGQRIQGSESERSAPTGRQIDEQGIKWPARPGQPQYKWEEPRVVAESAKQRLQRGVWKSRKPTKSPRQTQSKRSEQTNSPIGQSDVDSQGQTQSRLGRAVDEPACRVDRLRLLGNGVVPQCAAKAWISLVKELEKGQGVLF